MSAPRIPGYHELVAIGGGATSTVYRAEEPGHARHVAIKVLTEPLTSDADRLAFEREITAMGRLSSHPHIVDLIGSGVVGGHPYIVMPFYRNGTYASLVAERGPMAWEQVVDFGIKVASALETAHRRGFVHRDVKPANIYRGEFEGQPILADFGVSSFVAPSRAGDPTVAIAGTPLYTPPEILNGARPSVASDVYALGATLFGLLEGRAAYASPSVREVVQAITSSEPPPPLAAPVPDGLRELVASMLAKDPEQRTASALDVVGALNALQRDHDLLVTPPVIRTGDDPSGPAAASTPRPRVPTVARSAGPVVEATAGSSTQDVSPIDRPTEPLPDGHRGPTNPSTVTPAPLIRPGWWAAIAVGVLAVVGLAVWSLATGSDPLGAGGAGGGDEATGLVMADDVWTTPPRPVSSWTAHDGSTTALAWSADGATVATGGTDGAVRLWGPEGGDPIDLDAAAWVLDLAWAPDGGRLAVADADGHLALWDPERPDGPITGFDGTGPLEAVAWSPDQAAVATGGGDGTVRAWDPVAEVETWNAADGRGSVLAVAWSFDGGRLASGGHDGVLRLWSVDGRAELEIEANDDWIRSVRWSPVSPALVTAGADGEVVVWDGSTGAELRRLDVGADPTGGVAWSPDGSLVAVGTDDGVLRVWAVLADEVVAELSPGGDGAAGPGGSLDVAVAALAWAPDGERLALGRADGTVEVWDGGAG